jgi:hypothetical protein
MVLAQTIQDMSVISGLLSSFIVRPTASGTVRSCPVVHDPLARKKATGDQPAPQPAWGFLSIGGQLKKLILEEIFLSVREPFPRPDPSLQIFTLEIDGKPTLVFEATGFAEACEMCLDAELRLDLSTLTSDGVPIFAESATLAPRPAVRAEIAAFSFDCGSVPYWKMDGAHAIYTGWKNSSP